jgi:hypothetical protein
MGLDMTVYASTDADLNRDKLEEVWDKLPNWYWRKANQIHAWMVENVQDGEDDCGCYPLSMEKISDLKYKVGRVLANNTLAFKLLPNQAGFFFGSTEYDEWYFDELRRTAKYLDEMIKLHKLHPDTCFFYTSSW